VRVYTLHQLPGADALKDDPVLVKEGFNWPAALFTCIWALWAGMWLVALLIIIAGAALHFALELTGADPLVRFAAEFGFFAIVGFCANDWRRAKLHRQGYRLQGIVAAADSDSARRRWYDLHPPGAAGLGY